MSSKGWLSDKYEEAVEERTHRLFNAVVALLRSQEHGYDEYVGKKEEVRAAWQDLNQARSLVEGYDWLYQEAERIRLRQNPEVAE